MPWKNGGGSTTELAVFPAGAGLDDFVWRLSRAEICRDGPFSFFPGIDRSLALLSGDGLVLQDDSTATSMRVGGAPHVFAGERAVHAHLLESAVVDLNIMTRRSHCVHQLHRLAVGEHVLAATAAEQLLLYCVSGELLLAASEPAECSLSSGDVCLLTPSAAGLKQRCQVAQTAQAWLIRLHFFKQGES
ncbi:MULTISPECIES: HutD family protein [unclassified Undibacterium]|uniref:HutD/Ves family protein n=1 Tax=unclassified Undibacterium TaxID=2630295 RepID=UPI002AC8A6A9|nr:MULTISPECIES: HutD family protein [unclassified Undibacterium]MEB0139644.1 HutD family protein [Undibacterium sp. CCC2.1]MEB0172000.1 HutD family protein [Undibacterium sp. CCC1.1]MEB0176313.1 HutD family protein [Undibacterium sp. CCC3.4]MEB0213995.1 HutD family protein [Undibacterium sp. 5I2]WPX43611.1 HutD family protein [Undibacterium sp. CCC3.4]